MIQETNKLAFVDALRGYAILGVVFHHTLDFVQSGTNKFLNFSIDFGAYGVQLFYIVSAFTLFLSCENRIEKEKKFVLNFFIRRFFRIAPLYYLAIIFYLFWGETSITRMWLENGEHINFKHILSNILFFHQLNPSWINSVVPGGWSIAVEVSFYLFVPFLFQFINRFPKALILFTLSFLLMIVAGKVMGKFPLSQDAHMHAAFNFFYLPSQLPVFILGIIFYFAFQNQVQVSMEAIFYSIVTLLCLCFILSKYIIPLHITFSFLILIFVFIISKYRSILFQNKIICKIGELSYGIYLFHHAIFYLLQKLFEIQMIIPNIIANYILWFIISMGLTTGLAYILFIIIEKPCIDFGKMIIRKIELNKV